MTDERFSRRFRRRTIPTALLFLFGGVLVLVGFAPLCAAVIVSFTPVVPTGRWTQSAGGGLALFGGLALLLSGRWCWQGKWRRAVVGAVLGYGYVVVADQLLPK